MFVRFFLWKHIYVFFILPSTHMADVFISNAPFNSDVYAEDETNSFVN
jgi:hypothetical protein